MALLKADLPTGDPLGAYQAILHNKNRYTALLQKPPSNNGQEKNIKNIKNSKSLWWFAILSSMAVVLMGCSSAEQGVKFVPVRDLSGSFPVREGHHIVQKGETLFLIAWAAGWDYRDLAAVNHLRLPYKIYPGQKLVFHERMKPAVFKYTSKHTNQGANTFEDIQSPHATTKKKPLNRLPQNAHGNSAWVWPVRQTNKNVRSNARGLEIRDRIGTPVYAAQSGQVVYAGSGLKAYGHLVIIRHDAGTMSAYAHNQQLYTKEGDWVKAGQHIANMGYGPHQHPMIQFEVRKQGAVQNPLRYLP